MVKKETEMEVKHKLEMIYLMNIALYLDNKFDVTNFLQINKKCTNAISSLKINPYNFDKYSNKWLFNHFAPDTLNRNSFISTVEECDKQSKLIINPIYKVENNEMK